MMGRRTPSCERYTPDHVAWLRAQRGHTTAEAAAAVGVSRRTWQRWESGATTADLRCVREYALGLRSADTAEEANDKH